MTESEDAGTGIDSPALRFANAGPHPREEQTPKASPAGDRPGPRAVSPREREQAAAQLAAALTGALAEFILDAERQVLNRADRVRASTLDDLERQRTNVESLIGMFAERLRQQEEGLSSLHSELEEAIERLSRHADVIRFLSEAQAHQAALLGQLLAVLRQLAKTIGSPPAHPEARA